MDPNRAYFIARGESLRVAEEWLASQTEVAEKWAEHARRHGGPGALALASRTIYQGIATAETPIAALWRPMKRDHGPLGAGMQAWEPNLRTKAGKELQEEMRSRAFLRPDGSRLNHLLGIREVCVPVPGRSGLAVYWIGAQRLLDVVILSVPVPEGGEASIPPDAEPIRTSRYYQLLEEAQENEAKLVHA